MRPFDLGRFICNPWINFIELNFRFLWERWEAGRESATGSLEDFRINLTQRGRIVKALFSR